VDQRSNHHSVHRIVLPSGRRIEVVRFHDDGKRTESRPLHICPDCSSPLVQPLSWSETDDDRWVLLLSCPNCEWSTEDLCNQREVEELEDQLEDGLTEMLADLHRLAQANMADEIDRFVSGLQANLILPEDF
jgi:RNase P subunit RPR2